MGQDAFRTLLTATSPGVIDGSSKISPQQWNNLNNSEHLGFNQISFGGGGGFPNTKQPLGGVSLQPQMPLGANSNATNPINALKNLS